MLGHVTMQIRPQEKVHIYKKNLNFSRFCISNWQFAKSFIAVKRNSSKKIKHIDLLAHLSTMRSMWAFAMTFCPSSYHPSVRPRVNNFFKQLLLNHLVNFVETLQGCSRQTLQGIEPWYLVCNIIWWSSTKIQEGALQGTHQFLKRNL